MQIPNGADHNTNNEPVYKPRNFWSFVDDELNSIRMCRDEASTEEEGTALYNE